MANTSSRRSGKLLTGIVAFLLGFIFAIVVEVGVIVGAGYFIMTQPLETIFATIGFTNVDEDGNKFIDTDQVTTVMDLVNELKAIAGLGWDNMSIGDITVLSPALDAKLREWCGMAADYGITIDFDDLKATPLGDFEAYVRNDLMYGISLYDVVEAAVGDGGAVVRREGFRRDGTDGGLIPHVGEGVGLPPAHLLQKVGGDRGKPAAAPVDAVHQQAERPLLDQDALVGSEGDGNRLLHGKTSRKMGCKSCAPPMIPVLCRKGKGRPKGGIPVLSLASAGGLWYS